MKIDPFKEVGDELCDYCIRTEYGVTQVNTAPYNLCYGDDCESAYENYLESEGKI